MKPIRILHVVHSLEVGGLERVVVDLAAAFQGGGHQVSICCLSGKGKMAGTAEAAGVRVHALNRPPGIDPLGAWKVSRLIRKEGADVVHTHNEAGLIYGATGARLAGAARIVHTEHGREPGYDRRRALKAAERILMRRVDCLAAVSDALRCQIIQGLGIGAGSVATVFNGIDLRSYRNRGLRDATRASLGIDPGTTVLGHVARLVPLKNQGFLLELFSRLNQGRRGLKLVIAGSGPMQRELEQSCADLGIAGKVLFLGTRTDVPALLSAFDLFLLPSLTEGISITLLEALAAGVPSLASDVGGNPEIIRDGQTGRLLPVSDTGRWQRAIEEMLRDPAGRERMGRDGRESVARRFSLESMAAAYGRLYGIGS